MKLSIFNAFCFNYIRATYGTLLNVVELLGTCVLISSTVWDKEPGWMCPHSEASSINVDSTWAGHPLPSPETAL